jgi:hypothetical protein
MPSLSETQARVLGALVRGTGDGHAAALLRDGANIAAAGRLQVYRHNVHASLAAALAAVYPVIERLVGAPCLRALARRYVAAHPSRSGNLHAFGEALPAFLRTCAELAELAWLADVAALEWAAHEVYHEADDAPLDPGTLADVEPHAAPTLHLRLRAATRLLRSPHPIVAIWQANQPRADGTVPTAAFHAGGDRVLVARDGYEVELRRLDASEWTWLCALAEGRDLGAAVEAAWHVDARFDLGAVLARHARLGTFASAHLGATPGAAA